MMNVLIVSATKNEIAQFFSQLANTKQINEHLVLYAPNETVNFYFLFTGVSQVPTIFHITKVMQELRFDLAINVGIAGAISNIPIGEVVKVVNDKFYELGAEDNGNFISIHEMNLLSDADYPLNKESIELTSNIQLNTISKLKTAHGITVSKVHGNTDSIQKLQGTINKTNYDYIESMEGAAFAYVCAKMNVGAIQIRSISNKVEPRNRDNWNIPLAIKNLNEVLGSLCEEIGKGLYIIIRNSKWNSK